MAEGGRRDRRAATPEDPGADLLGRWMAHHASETPPEPPPTAPASPPAPADVAWWADRTPGSPTTEDPTDEDAGAPDDVVDDEEPATAPVEPEETQAPAPRAHGGRRAGRGEQPPASTSVSFPPRRGPRRVLGLALLLMLVATGVAGWSAWQETDVESLTLLGTLATLTLVTWAVRAGSALTTLEVAGGQLHVHQGGRRTTFDLTSPYTPVEVIGRPGRRGWKVVLGRGTARRPFVVDASLVDPVRFTEVLRRYRPE